MGLSPKRAILGNYYYYYCYLLLVIPSKIIRTSEQVKKNFPQGFEPLPDLVNFPFIGRVIQQLPVV